MIEMDALACCRGEGNLFNPSLRKTAACAYLLAQQPAQAADVLTRHLEYDVPPPPGGWHNSEGNLMPRADQSHHLLTPTSQELLKSLDEMVTAVRNSRDPRLYVRMAPVTALVAHAYFEAYNSEKSAPNSSLRIPANMRLQVPIVGRFLADTVYLADPDPEMLNGQPAPAVDMSGMSMLDAIARHAQPV